MSDKKLMSAEALKACIIECAVDHDWAASEIEAHIAALEEQVADALKLLREHVKSPVEYTLDDAIRQMPQAYVSEKESNDELEIQLAQVQRDTAERVAAVIERTLEILHADDYDDGEYTHQFSSWAHLEIAIRALAPNAEQVLAQRDARVRLAAFEQIHDNWEFTSDTEAEFDQFLHDEIIRLRNLTLAAASGEVSK